MRCTFLKTTFTLVSCRIFLLIAVLGLIILPASAIGSVVFSPYATDLSFHTGETVNFSVDAVMSSDVTWLLDGVIVQQDFSCNSSMYSALEDEAASYNLTVIVDEGTDILDKTWCLEVIPDFDVVFSPDSEGVSSRLDRAPEFSVNISETSDIIWYLDDELLSTYTDSNNSSCIPSVSETGNYSLKVHVSNDNGSIWKQWYWVATSTPSQIISGGSSGGGGSSGSVSSGEDYSNIKVKDVRMQVVNKGVATKFSFPDGQNPIDSLEFNSAVNAGYVKTTIEVLNNRSSSVSENPDDVVYYYANIITGKTGLENKIDDTRIIFHVGKKWIDENNIDVDSVRLNLYSSSKWKSFPAKVVNNSSGNISFMSTTSGFGSFAITGKTTETFEEDIVVVDMGGNSMEYSSDKGSIDSVNGTNFESEKEDVLKSVLRSMTELFIKRNPLDS